MRILLTDHWPPDTTEGAATIHLAQALLAAGHDVRLLMVANAKRSSEPDFINIVVCGKDSPQAELPFPSPQFSGGELTFEQLTDRQLAEYREVLRERLNAEIERFNPDVAHALQIWIWGQLLLESGVPYVLTATGVEVEPAVRDPRLQEIFVQTAENAGSIFIRDHAQWQTTCRCLPGLEESLLHSPRVHFVASTPAELAKLTAHYAEVAQRRFP